MEPNSTGMYFGLLPLCCSILPAYQVNVFHVAGLDRHRRIVARVDAVATSDVKGDQLRMQANLVGRVNRYGKSPRVVASVERFRWKLVRERYVYAVTGICSQDQRFNRPARKQLAVCIQIIFKEIRKGIPGDNLLSASHA